MSRRFEAEEFRQLQREQAVTGLFDVGELYDSQSPEQELDAYDQALSRLSEV